MGAGTHGEINKVSWSFTFEKWTKAMLHQKLNYYYFQKFIVLTKKKKHLWRNQKCSKHFCSDMLNIHKVSEENRDEIKDSELSCMKLV